MYGNIIYSTIGNNYEMKEKSMRLTCVCFYMHAICLLMRISNNLSSESISRKTGANIKVAIECNPFVRETKIKAFALHRHCSFHFYFYNPLFMLRINTASVLTRKMRYSSA